MIITYTGKVVSQKKGCPVCGRRNVRRKVDKVHTYYLPSGMSYTFRLGQSLDIPDDDAGLLLLMGDELVVGNTTP